MQPYDQWSQDAYLDSRPAARRRRRATTGVVIIDEEIGWSSAPRSPRRLSGPLEGSAGTRARSGRLSDAARSAEPALAEATVEFLGHLPDPEDGFAGDKHGDDAYTRALAEAAAAAARDEQPGLPAADGTGGPAQRRTVVITGRIADRYVSSRRGYEANLRPHHRSTFKPDRMAMWAVLMGVLLLLVAATSSHAATLAAHLAH